MLSRSILVQRDSTNRFSPLVKTALIPFHRPHHHRGKWVKIQRYEKVTIVHRRNFPPLYLPPRVRFPDFVDASPREARPRAISAGPTCRIADGPVVSAKSSCTKNYSCRIRRLQRILEATSEYVDIIGTQVV